MELIELIASLLIIVSFLIAICSFMLHGYNHFECHEYCKVECCSVDMNEAEYNLQQSHSSDYRRSSLNRNSIHHNDLEPQTWGRRMSQRMSQRTSIVVDEMRQQNCCCCTITRQDDHMHRDRLICCLYSSVDHMEFYPLAVTCYFILLIFVISFIGIVMYYNYVHGNTQNIFTSSSITYKDSIYIQNYCIINQRIEDVENLDFHEKSPFAKIRDRYINNIYVTIVYILVLSLIIWESLLNWYRFYSTKFMALKFTKPPYLKIFGLYSIYILIFISLCIVQQYGVFIIFPIIIILHLVFNSYCSYGFMHVLNQQYKHYVNDSRGISEIIIKDLRDTMRKLKICAILCILSSTLFLLTFTMCHYGNIIIYIAPMWFIINCICWMFTFAKNTLFFKHKITNCCKKCKYGELRCCNKNKLTNRKRSGSRPKPPSIEMGKTERGHRAYTNRNKPVSPIVEEISPQMDNNDDDNNQTDDENKDIIQRNQSLNDALNDAISDALTEQIVSSIQLPTIEDDKEYKDSPMSLNVNNHNNNNTIHDRSELHTPMSIVVTPANGTKPNRKTSETYQYPTDYEDNVAMDDEYFTFPTDGNDDNDNKDDDDSGSLTHTPSITQTMTSRKPKALELLGVNEELSRTRSNPSRIAKFTLKIDALHVPDQSTGNVMDISSSDLMNSEVDAMVRSQSARNSNQHYIRRNNMNLSVNHNINNTNSNINMNGHGSEHEQKEIMQPSHERQISKTMTYEPSMPSVWDLMVNDGFIPSQTIRSLHELEDYTIATNDQHQELTIPRQRSSHL